MGATNAPTDSNGAGMDLIYTVSIWLLPVLIAITFHEAAHGYVARFLGDDTASRLGRVSLNPVRHIDPFGHNYFTRAVAYNSIHHSCLVMPNQCRSIFGHFIHLVLAWCLSRQPDQ